MDIDKTTLADLSMFNNGEDISVFNKLDLCSTTHGSEQLRLNFSNTLKTMEQIIAVQQTIKLIIKNHQQWPTQISNGTVMVVEKFFNSGISMIPAHPSALEAYSYKLLHGPDFSLVSYSTKHCFDFIKGFQNLLQLFSNTEQPSPLKNILTKHNIPFEKWNTEEYQSVKTVNDLFNEINVLGISKYNYAITKNNGPVSFFLSDNDEASSLIKDFQSNWANKGEYLVEGVTWELLIQYLNLTQKKISILKIIREVKSC